MSNEGFRGGVSPSEWIKQRLSVPEIATAYECGLEDAIWAAYKRKCWFLDDAFEDPAMGAGAVLEDLVEMRRKIKA